MTDQDIKSFAKTIVEVLDTEVNIKQWERLIEIIKKIEELAREK
jgi:hypothetical protein